MFRPLTLLLSRVVQKGDLTFVDSAGERHRFGDGSGQPVRVRLADRRLERAVVLDPELAAGEGYMSGRLTVEAGTVYDFIALVMENWSRIPFPAWSRAFAAVRRATRLAMQFNPPWRARHNAATHYDIDPRIYELFLDPDLQYSCAYFTRGADLAQAQLAKKRHIAAKLALEPGLRILDIGCGWGGLATYLAKVASSDVVGITLSEQQVKVSRTRASKLGLSNSVRFRLADYREIDGHFERIVSVGMFEHVGLPHYRKFFRTISDRLTDDGVALIHTIGRSDAPTSTNPFIAKYIFPGGYIPALSEIVSVIETSGLLVTDVEVLRLHYAETLRAWRMRFRENWTRAAGIAGEEFCRMWEFYLAGSEAAFRYQGLVVYQIQLAKRVDALPLTRDYMLEAERWLAVREGGPLERPRIAGE